MNQIDDIKAKLIDAFTKAGAAHGFAFSQDNGEHADWAIWYANILQQPLSMALGRDLTQSEIVTCLIAAEEERLAMHGPDRPWPPFYADHFIARFAPAEAASETSLALYYYPQCPFCQRVLHAIQQTGADVELRHIWEEPRHRDDLQAARGRTTVPVLRITSTDDDRWLPESADIVRYLKERAA